MGGGGDMGNYTKTIRVFAVLMLIVSLALGSRLACADDTASGVSIKLTILSVNDFHGALVESGKKPGIAKLGQLIKEEKAKNPQGTIIVSAGDMFQGSPDSNMLYGKNVVEAMNVMGFAALVVGNHEYDWGIDKLKERIAQSGFPYLGANVIDKKTRKVVSFLQPYIIMKKNNLNIGIIGIATPETAYKTNPNVVSEMMFADPVQTVNELVPQLKQQGVEVIVVVSHLGCEVDKTTGQITGEAAEFARGVQGVDALITGHTHQRIMGNINGITIVQAGHSGQAVGRVDLVYSKPDQKIMESVADVVDVPASRLTEDAVLKEIMERTQAEIAPIKNLILGKTITDLNHDRTEVSLLGQWSSDVMRHIVNADIAFQNGGGLRASIPAGDITMGNLYEVMPFDNTLYTVDLTGQQVIKVLDHGIRNPKIGMVQFSGIIVKYDESKPQGQRIVSVTMLDGSPLQRKKTYRVVTNDFMASGGDEYTMFKEGRNGRDTNNPIRDVWVAAVKKQQIIHFMGDHRFMDITNTKRKTA
jgi:5'-nucleotidase / UDP-sugar diphosphatase